MKPQKPDRFERMVLKKTYPDMSVDKDDAINLLRNEHAWMRRMVSGLDDVSYTNMSDDYQAGMHKAYCTVLWRLAKRRK